MAPRAVWKDLRPVEKLSQYLADLRMVTSEATRVAVRHLAAGSHYQDSTKLPWVALGLSLSCASEPGAQRSQEHRRIRGATKVPTEVQQLEYSAVRIDKDRKVEFEGIAETSSSVRLAVSHYEYISPVYVKRFLMLSKFDDELAAQHTTELPDKGQHHSSIFP